MENRCDCPAQIPSHSLSKPTSDYLQIQANHPPPKSIRGNESVHTPKHKKRTLCAIHLSPFASCTHKKNTKGIAEHICLHDAIWSLSFGLDTSLTCPFQTPSARSSALKFLSMVTEARISARSASPKFHSKRHLTSHPAVKHVLPSSCPRGARSPLLHCNDETYCSVQVSSEYIGVPLLLQHDVEVDPLLSADSLELGRPLRLVHQRTMHLCLSRLCSHSSTMKRQQFRLAPKLMLNKLARHLLLFPLAVLPRLDGVVDLASKKRDSCLNGICTLHQI